MINKNTILICLLFFAPILMGQMQATFDTTINSKCNGEECDYDGPSILINEIMVSPVSFDGSLFESGSQRQGEWIELFNPDICNPIDISCYYLGNSASDVMTPNAGAGFQIPNGTVIPPAGFCIIRGVNAPAVPANNLVQNGGNTVEIIPNASNTCIGDTRLWFPNAGSWFAFYNENGVPQDAVSWGNSASTAYTPCIPTSSGCNTGVTTLPSYTNIPSDRKTYIYGVFPNGWGRSMRRIPDGGNWVTTDGAIQPTPGWCNSTCIDAGSSTCDGTATINVTGGTAPYTFLWDDWQEQTTQTAIELCQGTYTVTVTDANGIQEVFTVEIDNFSPNVGFSFPDEVCNEGQTIPFTNYFPGITGGAEGSFLGTGVGGNFFNVGVAGNGTFTLSYVYIDQNGCTDTAKTVVTVNPTPDASLSGLDESYCLTDLVIPLDISPPGGTLTGPGTINNDFDMLLAGPGEHTLTYLITNEFGCSDSDNINVEIFDTPTFTIEKTDSTCGENNGMISLLVEGGTEPIQYSIDGGNTFHEDFAFHNLPAGDYDLVVVDANGCSATGFQTLTSFEVPEVEAPEDLDVCVGDEVTLVASNPGNFPLVWSDDVMDGVTFVATDIGSTTYTVTVNDDWCVGEDEVTVTVHALPNVNAGADYYVCIGDTVVLTGAGAVTYEWDNNVTDGEPFVPEATEIYEVIGTDGWGCINRDEIEIEVFPLPEPDFFADTLFGCQPLLVGFTNTSDMDGIESCSWDFGDGGILYQCGDLSHNYAQSGLFDVTLTLTDELGCVGVHKKEEYIDVYPTPAASFWPDPVITGTSETVINFTNTSHNGDSYIWDFGYENNQAYSTHTTFTYPDDKEGTYTVTLIANNDFGCSDTTSRVVEVFEDVIFYIPNTFTPDADEFNQTFQPVFTQGFDPLDFELKIYNRWGELVFESHDAKVGWDGSYGTQIAPEGTYVWIVEFGTIRKSPRQKHQGHLNLLK